MTESAGVVTTHPEKVLFPDDGITKGELAEYYQSMAPLMIPHVRGRPITMERYPVGHRREGVHPEGRLAPHLNAQVHGASHQQRG